MLQTSMEQSQKQQKQWGLTSKVGDHEDELESSDEIRRLLMESNPYLLGVTIVVTILHTIFDMLAFKNDIQFWHKQKDMKGLSIQTIMLNLFFQVVIFLYLLEKETTYMILVSNFVGLIIEIWKITQAMNVEIMNTFPFISIKNKKSYVESETVKHDKVAMKYLMYLFFPLIIGYSIYRLIYEEHKGWYSFVLETLVSFIYMFGFIMMCPQLYLNYKLKSTAHLPWYFTFMYIHIHILY